MTGVQSRWTLREATPGDSDALASLAASAADGGRVTFAARHHVPVVQATRLRRQSSRCVLAVNEDGAVVGAAWVSLGRGRVGSEPHPVALLSSLAVHPQWRRRGIAAELTGWRLALIEQQQPDAIVVAAIQAGNLASEANARSWATQAIGNLLVTPTPLARRPIRSRPGLVVRPARLDDQSEVEQVIAGLDLFTRNHLLASPVTGDDLRRWSHVRLAGNPINRYFVVTDDDNRVLAGTGIEYEALFASLEVTRMPTPTRLASRVLGVVPDDGLLRNLNIKMAWYPPGNQQAARHLWQTLRRRLRGDGTTLVSVHSPSSPLQQMVRTPPWAPSTSLRIVARSPQPLPTSQTLGLSI